MGRNTFAATAAALLFEFLSLNTLNEIELFGIKLAKPTALQFGAPILISYCFLRFATVYIDYENCRRTYSRIVMKRFPIMYANDLEVTISPQGGLLLTNVPYHHLEKAWLLKFAESVQNRLFDFAFATVVLYEAARLALTYGWDNAFVWISAALSVLFLLVAYGIRFTAELK
ncbi:hypothetical protein ACFQFC_35245 [Amorphoplanes digitatis]